ncbi:MAG TPA: (5-formylfuran-3-yl)methyl phosphate synthase [Xanthobacteraceae bacterium]|nr:(5-formylfuran-3-yl)methyl phosphate synthase [Xanthobacteraceae bacterium]
MTGLLSSVASLAEMEVARRGGADIVDCKDPSRGALGAWDPGALTAAVTLWNSWPERKPGLSATVGDQPMVPAILRQAVAVVAATGVPMVKIGLAPSPGARACVQALGALAERTQLIGVFFADRAPDFTLLPDLARIGFRGVMIDTAGKASGGLRNYLDVTALEAFTRQARARGLMSGLAGSLAFEDIAPLTRLGADYLGFRGALCADGRTGRLDTGRLKAVRLEMDRAARPRTDPTPRKGPEREGRP